MTKYLLLVLALKFSAASFAADLSDEGLEFEQLLLEIDLHLRSSEPEQANLDVKPPTPASGDELYESNVVLESTPKQKMLLDLKLQRERYKTELCNKWTSSGICKYGIKCRFAHGSNELRPKIVPKNYRTVLCRKFMATGMCQYGDRCTFLHYYR